MREPLVDGFFYLEDMNSGIYCIQNKKNNKCYIGSSINLKKRKRTHFWLLKKDNHFNIHLQRSYNKHQRKNFKFIILETCQPKDVLLYEETYLSLYSPEYNISLCASAPMKGRKHSKETKKKFIGRTSERSDEFKEKMSLYWEELKSSPVHKYSLKGNYIESYDTPSKAAESHNVGKQAIINCCNDYCQSADMFQWSYEKKNKIDKHQFFEKTDNNTLVGCYNNGRSPKGKWKESIIKRNKEFVWTKEHKEKISKTNKKPVLQFDIESGKLLKEYDGVVDAIKETGLTRDQIYGQLNGKVKSILHYRWEYKND